MSKNLVPLADELLAQEKDYLPRLPGSHANPPSTDTTISEVTAS